MATKIEFDKKIFSREAILATCYWCAERAAADVKETDETMEVSFVSNDNIDGAFVEEFKTMAIHNQLRHQLREKFSALETTIIEKAFRPVSKG